MRTFILMWNPSISSYTMDDLEYEMEDFPYSNFDWSIWEHKKAHEEDRFFLVCVGEGNTGVIMSGYFSSDPWEGEDWSGKNRKVFYIDMEPDYIFHPEKTDILTTNQLMTTIPDFNWSGGHSGVLLTDEQSQKLENLWEEFLSSVEDSIYDNESACRIQSATIEDAIRIATDAHENQKDLDGKPVVFHALAVGLKGRNREEMITGFLHDVVEDTDETFVSLLMRGVDCPIVKTLQILTHNKNIDYYDYIQNIIDSKNPIAIYIKKADLQHNLERGRAGGHWKQVAKHEKAWEMIKDIE